MSFGLSDWYLDNETKKQKDQFDSGRVKSLGLARTKSQDEFEKSIFDNKARRAKYEGGLEKLQAISDYAAQENARINAEKAYDEETRRMITPYIEGVNDLSPGERRAFMHGIVDRMSEKSNGRLFLKSISDDGLKATVYNNGKLELVDLTRDFNAADVDLGAVANNSLNYGLRRDELAVKQQNADTKEKQTVLSHDINQQRIDQRDRLYNPQGQFDRSYASTSGKTQAAAIDKLDDSILKINQGLHTLDIMEDIANKHPDIFQSQLMNLWYNKEPSVFGNAIRQASIKLAPEKVKAITELNKYINELVVDKAALFARPNMYIEKVGAASVPNWMQSQEGFLSVLNNMRQGMQYTNDFAQNKRQAYTQNSPVGQIHPEAPKAMPSHNNIVTVKDPTTGRVVRLKADQAEIAIQRGGIVL